MSVKDRLKRTVILALIGLSIGVGVGLYQIKFREAQVLRQGEQSDPNAMAGLTIGGPFSLTDQDGAKVTEKDLEGRYALIYFGFTYCPAICPTELQKITQTLNLLEQGDANLAGQIQPVFISVDPERDTPEVLKDYVALFHPRLMGLTGTVPQIEDVKRRYRIYAAKVQTEEMSDYTMDHSSFIYLTGPDGQVLSIYRLDDTALQMADDIRAKMGART